MAQNGNGSGLMGALFGSGGGPQGLLGMFGGGGHEIVRAFGYSDGEWRLDETAHPFMTTPGAGDIRLTTNYRPTFRWRARKRPTTPCSAWY